ncbi:SbcC/MukB-like Walker B domain-containing protein [Gaoshiqia sediminis]|uniref:AAA family ATPase n=1 Tax=Gaoshiqia sediminis TaxID=2986998 RepID=A0AA42CA12_9BACT|nr:SbcC/MukB-like Walker B domain-containing protein [Gaoshiqia sediminis]MCW0484756.1 AAA family ATPase [Gaoshiqia sediminis]
MIPVQLTIQGLYSYQDKQTIDFTKLTAANLFGIFGTVGSGKSSILEAITFAIYGRTDRLNLSGDNRYYNMMNLKSNELLIDFIFETGKEQTAYRATVKGKRNGKNFEDVKALDRSAYRKNGKEWIPIETDSLEQAIGLSYDNFKRTIIIPQGQFQEFLQLGNKDRTQMMKELFNLGKFEFYYKVTSLEAKNNANKQNIEGQLLQLGTVNPEQISGYKAQLEQLTNELAEQSKRLIEYRKTEEEFRKLQELTQKKADAEKAFKALQEQEPVFKSLEQKIARYEQCVVQFKHLLDALNQTNERVLAREKQIGQDETKLKTQEEEIATLGKQVEELKPRYEKREELKQKAGELERLLRMKELAKSVLQDDERLKKGTGICEQTITKLEKAKLERQKLDELVKAERAKLPDVALLSNVKAWYVEKNNLDKQLGETEKEIEKYLQEEKVNRQEVSKILAETLFSQLPPDADSEVSAQYLQNKTAEIKLKLKSLEEQANHIQVKAQLKMYAEDLDEGTACPLCGSLHHPELFKTDDIQEAQLKLHGERELYEKMMDQITKFGTRLNLLDSQLQFIRRHQQELSEKKADQQKRISAHAILFVWDKYREEAELAKAFQEAERIQDELKKKEEILGSLDKEIVQEEKNKERFQAEVEKIKTALAVHQTELKTIGQQLKLIDPEVYRSIQTAAIETEKAGLLQEYARLEKEYGELTKLLAEWTKLNDTLSGSLVVNRKELQQDQQQLLALKKQLDEQFTKTIYQSVDEVRQVLAEPIDLDREKQNLARFKDQMVRSKSQLEQLLKEIGDRVYDSDAHQKLLLEIAAVSELQKQKNQELGKTEELLKKLQKDLESQASLKKEQERLELRAENLKTMKSLFKASGFVNYVSSVYLQNLCNAANDRFFQLTRQKLSLEITPDNNFQVRDFMNGGKVRSVKTLSGGQTFQAALSLALALADNIQKITESNQNFFFLDEGFGSLDKDSLSVVFDTLKSLRKENRIVGVISHVEEMQQEIDVHLRIDNQEERGSRIWESWMD